MIFPMQKYPIIIGTILAFFVKVISVFQHMACKVKGDLYQLFYDQTE